MALSSENVNLYGPDCGSTHGWLNLDLNEGAPEPATWCLLACRYRGVPLSSGNVDWMALWRALILICDWCSVESNFQVLQSHCTL